MPKRKEEPHLLLFDQFSGSFQDPSVKRYAQTKQLLCPFRRLSFEIGANVLPDRERHLPPHSHFGAETHYYVRPERPCGLLAACRVLPPALLHRLIVLAGAR